MFSADWNLKWKNLTYWESQGLCGKYGSMVAFVLGVGKHVVGVGDLHNARRKNSIAPAKLFLTKAPEGWHPKFCGQSWVGSLSWVSERFLAEPEVGFHCWVWFPGSSSWCGAVHSWASREFLQYSTLDVDARLLNVYCNSEYYFSCKISLHPLQHFRFDRIPEAY